MFPFPGSPASAAGAAHANGFRALCLALGTPRLLDRPDAATRTPWAWCACRLPVAPCAYRLPNAKRSESPSWTPTDRRRAGRERGYGPRAASAEPCRDPPRRCPAVTSPAAQITADHGGSVVAARYAGARRPAPRPHCLAVQRRDRDASPCSAVIGRGKPVTRRHKPRAAPLCRGRIGALLCRGTIGPRRDRSLETPLLDPP